MRCSRRGCYLREFGLEQEDLGMSDVGVEGAVYDDDDDSADGPALVGRDR